jgi:hypothetical protein
MKQLIARMIQMLVVVLVGLFVGSSQASAGTKWDRCVNRMNSRGDKVPDAKGRHCWDTDDNEEDEDDDKCGDSKKCCGGKKSCRDKDDDKK